MNRTNVTVKEINLSDNSKVYDVILTHYQSSRHTASIAFEMQDERQADLFSGDLLEVLRRHGFISK